VRQLRDDGVTHMETYTPFRLRETERLLGRDGPSPVRLWTLAGALSGAAGGFALAIGLAAVNGLVVGGRITYAVIVPYCVIAFEGLVLMGVLANVTGLFFHGRLGYTTLLPRGYTSRVSQDRFGLFVTCEPDQAQAMQNRLHSLHAEVTHVTD
jgi:molybdopterin-containing oxidoreductase family membrane subunit